MTIRELIDELEALAADPDNAAGDDATVYLAQPTHDHWRSTKAAPVVGVNVEPIEHSAYHDAMVIADENKYEDDPRSFEMAVVIAHYGKGR